MTHTTVPTTFTGDFSEPSFWAKVLRVALQAGRKVIGLALRLFYAWQSADTPVWAKGVIAAALGYFISPIDAIPDVIPVIGYTDDLGVLVSAVSMVAAHITPEIEARAEATLRRWFG